MSKDGGYRFAFWYDKAYELSVNAKIVTDVATVCKIHSTVTRRMENDARAVEEKYDTFYERTKHRIDDVLAIWSESDLSENDRTNWIKQFGKSYSKNDLKNDLFWWESRNERIKKEKAKEERQKRKIQIERAEATAAAARRPPGLRLARQLRL